jgi:hypothetical protein
VSVAPDPSGSLQVECPGRVQRGQVSVLHDQLTAGSRPKGPCKREDARPPQIYQSLLQL